MEGNDGTSLHALWDDARLIFDGQQVNHFFLFCPHHLPGNLLIAAHHFRVLPLPSMHWPANTSVNGCISASSVSFKQYLYA